jgi:hypothetical protein
VKPTVDFHMAMQPVARGMNGSTQARRACHECREGAEADQHQTDCPQREIVGHGGEDPGHVRCVLAYG